MGTCYSRGDTELKESFGKGNEFQQKSQTRDFNERYFEVGIDYDNKFEVFETVTLVFYYWYYKHYKDEKKLLKEEQEKQYDTVTRYI